MSSSAGELLPELANFKGLARDMMDLQKQYAAAGDLDSSRSMIQIGLTLSGRFNGEDGSKFFIGQLVGNAMEAVVLGSLDQNISCDFLGGKTPTERLAELKQRKADFRALQQAVTTVTMSDLSDVEWANYAQRVKIYGELEAMRWLQQRNNPPTPNIGN